MERKAQRVHALLCGSCRMTYAPKSERLHVDKTGRPGGADLTERVRFHEAGQVGQSVATGADNRGDCHL